MTYEYAIIGGGPAGLSAALVAGRARRRVLLLDDGKPRNAAAHAMHSFVTRDRIAPRDFREIARAQLQRYRTVESRQAWVEEIAGDEGEFKLALAGQNSVTAKQVLIAGGVVDMLPDIPGVPELWGSGVHACVYCDGYENAGERWGVLAESADMFEYSLFMTAWSDRITLFTNGGPEPSGEIATKLRNAGVRWHVAPVRRLVRNAQGLEAAELANELRLPLDTFWIRPRQRPIKLVEDLGLALTPHGSVRRDDGQTSRSGIFVAGDIAWGPNQPQQALEAAADGARMAFVLNHMAAYEAALLRRPEPEFGGEMDLRFSG